MVDQGVTESRANYSQYPAPLARYEDVVANPQLFMTTLQKFHAAMATKFMIPIIGGRDLDLHKLFVEVTSRGGIDKILSEKRWKEVTSTFSFPSTATNASFVLRKYYYSLLQHYEKIYYFQSQGSLRSSNAAPDVIPSLPKQSTFAQPSNGQLERNDTAEFVSGATTTPSVGCPVIGVIDGKFESGYLVTITLGNEKMKGVLYHTPPTKTNQVPHKSQVSTQPALATTRHSKRKRDPNHPKPNRSGYNFFFSEQHALLKPLYPGKEVISKMIGELWNKLKDNEKSVYQEKAIKDKERYKMEMEDYRERLRENQVINDAIPIQQHFPGFDVEMVEVNVKDGTTRDSSRTLDNESHFDDDDFDDDDDDDDDDDNNYDDEMENLSNVQPLVGDTIVESGTAVGNSETLGVETSGDFQIAIEDEEKEACENGENGSLFCEKSNSDSPLNNVEHENFHE